MLYSWEKDYKPLFSYQYFTKKNMFLLFFSWNHLVILTLNELQYQSKLLLQEIPWRPKVHLPPRNCRTFQQCWDSDSHAWWQPGTNDKNDGNELFFLWKGSLCQILGLWGDFQLYFQEEKMTEELYTNNNVSFVLFVIYTGASVLYGVDR